MEWMWNGVIVNTPQDGAIGFVYRITNIINGRVYLGKKSLVQVKLKRIGNRNKRLLVESNWREYWGSNKQLLEDIAYHGEVNFHREVLHWCQTKGDASYLELKQQILHGVLEHPTKYYNNFIGARIHRKHLKLDFMNDGD
jgi:hypothetical protein